MLVAMSLIKRKVVEEVPRLRDFRQLDASIESGNGRKGEKRRETLLDPGAYVIAHVIISTPFVSSSPYSSRPL